MKYYRKLTGKRLYLSPVNVDDADTYLKWLNEDATVAVNFGQYSNMVSSVKDLSWIFEPPKNMHRFSVVLLESDLLIGSISIHNIDHLNRNAYIGIFIGEEKFRNSGYGTEAIKLILKYGFKTLNLHSINLSVHADNYSGISCYKKLGFVEVGRLPEVLFVNGKYIDKIYMSILENQFIIDDNHVK